MWRWIYAYVAVDLCMVPTVEVQRCRSARQQVVRNSGTRGALVGIPNQAVVLVVSFKSQVAVLTREAWRRVHSSAVSENLSDATNTVLPGLPSNAHEDHVRTGL